MKKRFLIFITVAILSMSFVLGLTACNSGNGGFEVNGTYYLYSEDDEEYIKTDYLTLEGYMWNDSKETSGTFKIEGRNITFNSASYKEGEEKVGTIVDGVIKLPGSFSDNYYCKEGKTPFDMEGNANYEAVPPVYAPIKNGDTTVGYTVTALANDSDKRILIEDTYNGKPVTTVSEYAFYNKNKIKSMTIGGNIETIGARAFWGCRKLDRIVLPNSVKMVGESAFYGCSGALSVDLGKGVVTIADKAFGACSELTSVSIPATVTSIGSLAFSNCNKLTNITYAGTKAQWAAIEKGEDFDLNTGKYTVTCSDGAVA